MRKLFNNIILFICITYIFIGCQIIPGKTGSVLEDSEGIIDSKIYEEEEIIVKINKNKSIELIDDFIPGLRLKEIVSFNGFSYYLYKLDGSDSTENILNLLNNNDLITTAERNNGCSINVVPDDTYYNTHQYAPRITDCEDAWDITTGNSSVIVAVLDSGINGEHRDFGTGQVIAGYDFINDVNIAAGTNSDDNGHGTHVAGIVGAAGNNNTDITGVAWNTTLMPVKVLDRNGWGTWEQIVAGMIYAVDNGADIINMSLAGSGYSQIKTDAAIYAVNRGVTVIVAMGNNGLTTMQYPAGCPGVIAVGSTNPYDQISSFSTTGFNISISAPGESIYSLDFMPLYNNFESMNNSCVFMSGTSMATPFVAGTAALMLALNPDLSPQQIKSMLENSADDLGEPGYDIVFGHGRVNVYNAVTTPVVNNYGKIIADADYENVEIMIYNDMNNKIVQTTVTSEGDVQGDMSGKAEFPFLKPGDYVVSATINGNTRSRNVSVSAGNTENVNF